MTSEWFGLVVVVYLVLGVAAIVAVRRFVPGGWRRVLVMATVIAVFFSPGFMASHGVAVLPAWLVVLDCALGRWREYGSDWMDLCGLTSFAVVWLGAAVIGFGVVGLGWLFERGRRSVSNGDGT